MGAPSNYVNTNADTCSSTDVVANFDDLTVTPAISLTPVPTPYKGLYFQGFNLAQPLITVGQPGVVPHSPQNFIYTAANSQTTGGTPMFSVNYPNSNVKSFSLWSFYFSCVTAQTQGAVGFPSECFVQVTGYKGNDDQANNAAQTCSQQFHYLPGTNLGQQQQAFSGGVSETCFSDIQYAMVTFNNPGTNAALQPVSSLQLDDVAYEYKTC